MQELKEKLLSLDVFEDNEYLDFYCDLIEKNRNTKREKFKTQKHHIIPRCYFKYKNLKIDNSKNNLVDLIYANHVMAHYYLCLCTTDLELKYKLQDGFFQLTFRTCKYDNFNPKKDLEQFNNIYNDWVKSIKGHKTLTWISYNGKLYSSNELQNYLGISQPTIDFYRKKYKLYTGEEIISKYRENHPLLLYRGKYYQRKELSRIINIPHGTIDVYYRKRIIDAEEIIRLYKRPYTDKARHPKQRYLEVNGYKYTLREISNKYNLSLNSVIHRYERGWTAEEIILTPKGQKRKSR